MALSCQGYNTSAFLEKRGLKECNLNKEERVSVEAIYNILCDQIQDVLVSYNPVLVIAVKKLFSDWINVDCARSESDAEGEFSQSTPPIDYKGKLISVMLKMNEEAPIFVVESRKHNFVATVRFKINKTRFQVEGDPAPKRKLAERSAAYNSLNRIAKETTLAANVAAAMSGLDTNSTRGDPPSGSDVISKKSSKAKAKEMMPASVARKGALSTTLIT